MLWGRIAELHLGRKSHHRCRERIEYMGGHGGRARYDFEELAILRFALAKVSLFQRLHRIA
jgi:hypothetical protein